MFQLRYSRNPMDLFKIIRHCLATEMKLVAQIESLSGAPMNMGGARGMMDIDIVSEMAQQIEGLRRRTQETAEDLRKIEQEQESFAICYHECTKLNVHLNHVVSQPQLQKNMELDKLRR